MEADVADRRRRGVVTGVVAALAVLAVIVSAASALRAGGHELRGTVTVQDLHVRTIGASCSGARPFLDVHAGAPVVVLDSSGTVLAEGSLGSGKAINAYPELEELERAPSGCVLRFAVAGVAPSEAYTVQVGEHRSTEVTREELEAASWELEITLP